jgi:hypothetical protein
LDFFARKIFPPSIRRFSVRPPAAGSTKSMNLREESGGLSRLQATLLRADGQAHLLDTILYQCRARQGRRGRRAEPASSGRANENRISAEVFN